MVNPIGKMFKPSVPPVDSLVPDSATAVADEEVEERQPLPPHKGPPFAEASPPPPPPIISIDDIVKEIGEPPMSKKYEDAPESLFGPAAASLLAASRSTNGLLSGLKDVWRDVVQACEWVKSGAAKREWAVNRYLARLDTDIKAKDALSTEKTAESKNVRATANGLMADDPLRTDRIKRADALYLEAVRLQNESVTLIVRKQAVVKALAKA